MEIAAAKAVPEALNASSANPAPGAVPAAPARNIRSTNPLRPSGAKALLADSDDPALEWWDHERNDEKTFRTVTLRATRECHWICRSANFHFRKKSSK